MGLFAVLLVICAPLVSQTLRANDPAVLALSSFCSVGNMLPDDGTGKGHAPTHALNDEACAYCGLALHVPVLPSMADIAVNAPARVAFALPATAPAPRPYEPRRVAQPRGPPASFC
jgi:hypothetical protein